MIMSATAATMKKIAKLFEDPAAQPIQFHASR
jgi:hypothetical protein